MVIRNSMAIIIAISAISFSAFAGEAPDVGGSAEITVTLTKGGIGNASAGAGMAEITAKQAVGSVLHGKTSGGLKINVTLTEGGILNIGAGTGAGKVTACQSVGTIGSDC